MVHNTRQAPTRARSASVSTISAPHPPVETVAPPRPTLPPGTTFLTITRGPRVTSPVDIPITADLTIIGRHPGCDIVLDDMTVSRWHAEIRRTGNEHGGDVTVTDLGSLNGTYLNHNPIDSGPLTDGDKLWIGAYRLQFRTSPDRFPLTSAQLAAPAEAGTA